MVLAALALGAPQAHAQISYSPCPRGNNFACAHLVVPLDPSGATPGTLSLAIRRHRAPVGDARSAIIALAGGPGQAAIPFAEEFDELLGPIAATRDLIVFDQRGIGLSHPLSCQAFEHGPTLSPSPGAVAACATQLGPGRAFYSTEDSVADIEAIRRAGGYEKLVLYGTSYGTKLAELYAQAYPQHVEALILDSVVPPAGPDPLNLPTFAALHRVLRSTCARHACRGVTRSPFADLARLVRRMRDRRLEIRAIGPRGHPRRVAATPEALLNTLLAGDFSGPLRAALVTADRAAAAGDDAPLGRLLRNDPGRRKRRRRIRCAAVLRDELRRPGLPLESHGDAGGAARAGRRRRAGAGRARLRAVQRTRRDRFQRRAPVRGLALLDAVRARPPPRSCRRSRP